MDKNEKKDIGLRIKQVRHKLGLTQKDLAGHLGCHRSLIGHFETASAPPSLEFLHLLSTKYNVSIDWIIRGSGSVFVTGVEHEPDVQKMLSDFSKSAPLKHRILGDFFMMRNQYIREENNKGNGNEHNG